MVAGVYIATAMVALASDTSVAVYLFAALEGVV